MRSRVSLTIAANRRALLTIAAGFADFNASPSTSSPPTPSAAAPASMNSAAVFRLTPPVGTSGICGNGPFRALMYLAPPTCPQGKTFTKSAPAFQAVMTSVGVNAPAIIKTPSRTANSTVARFNPGLTRNSAPASRQRRAVSTSSTVPAPISASETPLFLSSRITSIAPGTVMVISTMGIPPSHTAWAASSASAGDDARTTGTTPISKIRFRTPGLFIESLLRSASNTRTGSLHHANHLLDGHHAGVARGGHCQGSMRRAAIHRPLRIFAGEQAVDEAGGKRIASSHAIKNLKVLPIPRLVELAVAITDRAPVVAGSGLGLAQGGGDHLEGKFLHHRLDHLLERFRLDVGNLFIESPYLKAQRCGKVLLVADHDIDLRCHAAVDLLSAILATNRLPQRFAVVQIVRDDRAVLAGRLYGFHRHVGRGLRERAEYPAGVEPACPSLAENVVPIDVARLLLRGRRVTAIRASQGGPDSKSSLREVEAIAHSASNAVIADPADQGLVDSSLMDQILQQPADGVVGECRHDRRLETEASLESARNVVFSPAFRHFKGARRPHPPVSRLEPQHHLAQADQVPPALFLRFDRQCHPVTLACDPATVHDSACRLVYSSSSVCPKPAGES